MDFDSFYSIVNKDVNDRVISHLRYVVNFYRQHKNQKEITLVSGEITNTEVVDTMKGFAVAFNSSLVDVNKYIAIITPNDPLEEFRSFISMYLPAGCVPTHLYVDSNDVSEIDRCYGIIKEEYPDICYTQTTYVYNYNRVKEEEMLRLIPNRDLLFPIADYCVSLESSYGRHNADFVMEFMKTVDEIEKKSVGRIIYYGEEETGFAFKNIFPLIVSELYIRNAKCRFYFNPQESVAKLRQLSSSIFNPDFMLVEDLVDFLLNVPVLFATQKGSISVFNMVRSSLFLLGVYCVPLKNLKGKVEKKTLVAKDLKIRPLNNYYNLESDDLSDNLNAELELRELIKELYKVFNLSPSETLDVTNIFIFIEDGVEYVAYCKKINFSLSCFSYMTGQGLCPTKISLDDLRGAMFLDFVLNSKRIVEECSKNFKAKNLTTKSLVPKRVFRNYSYLFRNYKIDSKFKFEPFSGTSKWKQVPNVLFLSGMYSFTSYTSKISIVPQLKEDLGCSKVRNMLDSFGGFNLISNPTIKISTYED